MFFFSNFQITWIISDPSDGSNIELHPGDRNGRFEAQIIQTGKGDTVYDIYLRFENINKAKDSDKKISVKFDVNDSNQFESEIKFEITESSVTQPPTTVPDKPKPEPNEEIPKTTQNPQESSTEKVQKQDTGSSLYIIISIIVIVILLCVLYYATKRCACCRNKEPRNSEILAEEGQALMKNDENKMKDETNDEVNEDSKSNEEPNTEGT